MVYSQRLSGTHDLHTTYITFCLLHEQILSVDGYSRISQNISLNVLYLLQARYVGVNFNRNNTNHRTCLKS